MQPEQLVSMQSDTSLIYLLEPKCTHFRILKICMSAVSASLAVKIGVVKRATLQYYRLKVFQTHML